LRRFAPEAARSLARRLLASVPDRRPALDGNLALTVTDPIACLENAGSLCHRGG
jgi:hypothetical protein